MIDELEGCADEATVHELREFLLGEDEEEVTAFQQELERRISELRRTSDENGVPLTESEACAVIAAGKKIYRKVLQVPAEVRARAWDTDEAILLMQTAPEVLDFLRNLPKSPESPVRAGWIVISFGSDFTIPAAYEDAAERLTDRIDESPEWCRWWAASEASRLFILLELMKAPELRESPRLRRRHEMVEFSMSVDPQRVRRLRLPGRSGKAAEVARDDLRLCLERVAAGLSLGGVPPFPSADER